MTAMLGGVLGWYFVIFSAFLLLRPHAARAMMSDMFSHRPVMFMMAIFNIILGLLMVLNHNIWIMAWPVFVTVLAWMILIGGILRLFFMDEILAKAQGVVNHPGRMNLAGIIILILGIFLLLHVYWV